jgi:hypothetical protein
MSDPTTISPARSNEEEPIIHLRLGDHEDLDSSAPWLPEPGISPDALLVQDTSCML